MAIRIIFVPVSGAEGSSVALETALQVGRHVDAHVEAFHVSLDPRDSVAYMAEGMTSNMIQDIMGAVESEAKERRDKARQIFEDACRKKQAPVSAGRAPGGFSASFATAVGREDDLLAMRGRLCDLIVASRSPDRNDTQRTTLEIALLETGRPVLVAPPSPPAVFGKTIAVAWNGSIESARALGQGAGLAFLGEADKVVVLALPEGQRAGAPVADLLGYFACHGITASAVEVKELKGGVGNALLDNAKAAGADMLIMGAYTRSRLRHLIFGGATSEILAQADLPVLMAH